MAKKANANNVFSGITMPNMEQSDRRTPAPASAGNEKRKEGKKRYNLYIAPELYEDVQHIAFMQRRSMSEIVSDFLAQYRNSHKAELDAYNKIPFPD